MTRKTIKKNHHPFSLKALEDIKEINKNGELNYDYKGYLNVLDSLFDLAYKLGKESK